MMDTTIDDQARAGYMNSSSCLHFGSVGVASYPSQDAMRLFLKGRIQYEFESITV